MRALLLFILTTATAHAADKGGTITGTLVQVSKLSKGCGGIVYTLDTGGHHQVLIYDDAGKFEHLALDLLNRPVMLEYEIDFGFFCNTDRVLSLKKAGAR